MDWINTANGLIALITALFGLIGTGIGAFFAVRNWIKALKEKSAKEIWAIVMAAADAGMKQAEESGKSGKDKKAMVIEIVGATCKSAGIDITPFLEQLSDYIDQTIQFVNDMKDAK